MKGEPENPTSVLVNTNCWAVVGGAGTGSLISLHFGRKIAKSRPTHNHNLPPEWQAYEGEFVLFISCAWRVLSNKEIACGSFSNNERGGVMLTGLYQILDQKVRQVELIPGTFDLRISFENNLQLHLFNNLCEADNLGRSYSITSPEYICLADGMRFEVNERR